MANSFTLNGNDYTHLTERSHYNHNFYQHTLTGEIIKEVCDEYNQIFNFYREENGQMTFIGASEKDITEGLIIIYPDWC